MVAIITGAGLGLENSSADVLKGRGVAGDASQGLDGESVLANAATGNLILQRQDDILTGRGPDNVIDLTYNSLGTGADENGDNWTLSAQRYLAWNGSALVRYGPDGAQTSYAYNSSLGQYISTSGDGAYLTIAASTYIWVSGDGQTLEHYDNSHGLRLDYSTDGAGNELTYSYDGSGRVNQVTNSTGDYTAFTYSGNNLTTESIHWLDPDGTTWHTSSQFTYAYDGSNRLSTVTIDKTPDNLGDSSTYTITYGYDATSGKVNSITQDDGSSLTIGYSSVGGVYRVTSLVQTSATGVTRTTSLSYNTTTRVTTVTDPASQATEFHYDTSGQLTSIVAPAPAPGGSALTTSFAYDGSGNVTDVTDPLGLVTHYDYDARGNRLLERDAAGVTLRRTFDSHNRVITRTVYTTPDPDGAGAGQPSGALTTRYAYDQNGDLRFEVDPAGHVIEHQYDSYGQLTSTIDYKDNLFSLTGLGDQDPLPMDWSGNLWAGPTNPSYWSSSDATITSAGTLDGGAAFQITPVSSNANVWQDFTAAAGDVMEVSFSVDSATGHALFGVWASGGPTPQAPYYFYGSNLDSWANLTSGPGGVIQSYGGNMSVWGLSSSTPTRVDFYRIADQAETTFEPYFQIGGSGASFVISNIVVRKGRTALESWAAGLSDKSGTQRTDYTYDLRGNLASSTSFSQVHTNGAGDTGAPVTKTDYLYDRHGFLLSRKIDGESATDTYAYDGLGRITSHTDLNATTTSYTFSDTTPTTTITVGGRTTVETFDKAGELISSSVSGSGVTAMQTDYLYDSQGQLRVVTDPVGNKTYFIYDQDGRKAFDIAADGAVVQYRYNDDGQVIATVAYKTLMDSTPLGALITSGVPSATALADTLGWVSSNAGADDRWAWTIHDSAGRVIETIDALGAASVNTYDGTGNVTAVTAYATPLSVSGLQSTLPTTLTTPTPVAADRTTRFFYDVDGRLVGVLSPEGNLTETVYDAAGEATSTIAYASKPSSSLWATADLGTLRTSAGTGASNPTTRQVYDARGLLIATIDPTGSVTGYSYDQYGRLFTTIAYNTADTGGAITDQASLAGWITSYHGSSDRWSWTLHDAGGRLIETIDALGAATVYAYDSLDNVVSTTSYATPLSVSSLKTTPPTGLTTPGTDAADRFARFFHDSVGRQVGELDAEHNLSQLVYDADGRVVQTLVYATQPNSYYWASGTFAQLLTSAGTSGSDQSACQVYDAAGQIFATVDAEGGVVAYTRNAFGEVVETAAYATARTPGSAPSLSTLQGWITSNPDANDRVTRCAYDADGRRIAEIDGEGYVVEYVYDAFGQVVTTVHPTDALGVGSAFNHSGWGDYFESVTANATTAPDGTTTGALMTASGNPTAEVYTTLAAAAGSYVTYTAYLKAGTASAAVIGTGQTSGDTVDMVVDLSTGAITQLAVAGAASVLEASVTAAGGGWYRCELVASLSAAPRFLNIGIATGTTGNSFNVYGDLTSGTPSGKTIQVWGVTYAQGVVAETAAYDHAGRLTDTTDALGTVTHLDYNALGEMVAQTVAYGTADAATTFYAYDAAGRLAYQVDPLGYVTRFTHNAFGEVTSTERYAGAMPLLPAPAAFNHSGWSDYFETLTANATTAPDGTTTGALMTASSNPTAELYTTLAATAGSYVTYTAYLKAGSAGAAVIGTGQTSGDTVDMVVDLSTGAITQLAVGGAASVLEASVTAAGNGWYRCELVASLSAASRFLNIGVATATTGNSFNVYGDLTSGTPSGKTIQVWGVNYAEGALDPTSTPCLDAWVASLSDKSGAERADYGYDLDGQQTSVTTYSHTQTGGAGDTGQQYSTTTTAYDAFGDAASVTDPRTKASFTYYDHLGRATLSVDADNHVTQTAYRFDGQVASVKLYATAASGTPTVTTPPTFSGITSTTGFTYDRVGRLTQTTDAMSASETYTLDAFGDRATVTNKLGGVTTNSFDHRGLLVAEELPIASVDSSGATVASTVTNTYAYDGFGNLHVKVEASGLGEQRTTTYSYDLLNRPHQQVGDTVSTALVGSGTFTTASGAPTTTYSYDVRGNLIETVDPDSNPTYLYYDLLDRKIAEVDALSGLTVWTYDASGNVLTETRYATPLAGPITAGGPAPATSGDHRITTYGYDKENRLVSTTVGDSGLTSGAYNGSSYATSTGGLTTTYAYDASGNLISQTDPNGGVTYSFYDDAGRRTASVDALGYMTESTLLDAEGNVLTEVRYAATVTVSTPGTKPSSPSTTGARTTTFTYDKMGRRLTETRQGVVASSVNATTGALTTASAADATVTYTYNALGEVLTKTEATGDVTTYTYDSAGRLLTETDATYTDSSSASVARRTVTAYDGLGNVTRVRVQNGATTAAGDPITTYAYGAGGRLTSMTDADGAITYYAYDLAGRVTQARYSRTKADGTTTLTEAQATGYDALGRVVFQAKATNTTGTTWVYGDDTDIAYNAYGEVATKGVKGGAQETYAYDGAGRLERTNAGDGTLKFYLYDKAGNQTLSISASGGVVSGTPYSAADLSSYATASAALSAAGTVTSPTSGFLTAITTYDARNQATSSILPASQKTGATTAAITSAQTYNAFGEVATQTDALGHATTYSYDTLGKVIETQLTAITWVGEDGKSHTDNPTTQYFYDLSGRLVGTGDAINTQAGGSHHTTRILLAGTGYGGSDALAATEFHPDGGRIDTGYDVYGDALTLTTAIDTMNSVTETYVYDHMHRLVEDDHPMRVADGTNLQLIDYYAYDQLGQRLKHTNDQLSGAEVTDYDLQGRIVSSADFSGLTTTYAYAYDAKIASGLGSKVGTAGGWTTTTTNASKLSSSSSADYFGRTTARSDFGKHDFAMTYDLAGRMTEQASKATGQDIKTSYFNTGLVATIVDNAGQSSGVTATTSYGYDAAGRRVAEGYVTTNGKTTVTYQSTTSSYDDLGRLVQVKDGGLNGSYPITTTNTYDLNGNIRETATSYVDLASSKQSQDYWYTYDLMNRTLIDRGVMASGVIGLGASGSGAVKLTYDLAGRRTSATTMVSRTEDNIDGTHHPAGEPISDAGWYDTEPEAGVKDGSNIDWDNQVKDTPYDLYYIQGSSDKNTAIEHYNHHIFEYREAEYKGDYWTGGHKGTFDTQHVETYSWSEDDQLETIGFSELQSDSTWTSPTHLYEFTRDTMGRETARKQVKLGDVTYTDYEDDGRVKSSLSTHYDSGWYTVETANTYDSGGTLTSVDTKSAPALDWTGTARASLKDYSTTAYTWSWWDSAQEASQVVTPDGKSTATPDSQTWTYDANGHVTSIAVSDPQGARTLTYVTDVAGQVMVRQDTTTVTSGGSGLADVLAGVVSLTATRPMEMYYYANGVRFGDVGNDSGPAAGYGFAPAQTTVFRGGSSPTQFADFDQSYDPVGPTSSGGQAAQTSYLAQGGESLSALAQSTYGDSSLWWMIAEANGLSGDTTLAQGQRLTLPNATRSQNTSSTFRPYDPNEALGNIAFRSPNPPKQHNGGCGTLGQIIAFAVTWIVTAVATVALSTILGPAAPEAGAMIGDAAGQLTGMALGVQSKFSWNEVALAGVSKGVSQGLGGVQVLNNVGATTTQGEKLLQTGVNFVNGAARGMAANALTQGIGRVTGLQQSQFDWASVAMAGVTSGTIGAVSPLLPGAAHLEMRDGALVAVKATFANNALSGMAGAIAGAGTKTIIDGSDFGDNILKALPSVIASTVGQWAEDKITSQNDGPSFAQEMKDDAHWLGDKIHDGAEAIWDDVKKVGSFIGGLFGAGEGMHDPLIGDVHVTKFAPGATLVPILRGKGQTFTQAAIGAEGPGGPAFAVNGELFSLDKGYLPGGYTLADLKGDPRDPSEVTPHGEVIRDGKLVAGRSSPLGFFVSQGWDAQGNVTYTFGQGDPAANSAAAFGGGIPLIIDGLNYGATKTIDPQGVLIQQSNLGFADMDSFGADSGKVVVAYNPSSKELAVVVQPDGAKNGMTLTGVRDYLSGAGYKDAIAFDGSSSATMVVNKSVQIAPIAPKNATISVGIGVKPYVKGR